MCCWLAKKSFSWFSKNSCWKGQKNNEELPGGVGGGVDLVAFSSVNTVSSSSGCFEVFIIGVDDVYWLLRLIVYWN